MGGSLLNSSQHNLSQPMSYIVILLHFVKHVICNMVNKSQNKLSLEFDKKYVRGWIMRIFYWCYDFLIVCIFLHLHQFYLFCLIVFRQNFATVAAYTRSMQRES